MEYLPLLKTLRGRAAILEIGDVTRPAIEVVSGMIWDVFFEDKLLLLITVKDTQAEKIMPTQPPGIPPKPKEFETVREFNFKWIRVANIISVVTEANISINRQTRTLKPSKNEPLYTDEQPQWSVLNNNICRLIFTRLRELKLDSAFGGCFRNESNDAIAFEEAFPAPAAVAAPSQTTAQPVQPAAAPATPGTF
jgi:hypothetical protein